MRSRAVLALAVVAAAVSAARSQARRNVQETIDAALRADAGLTAPQRAEISAAIRDRFADYALQTVSGPRAEAVQVALRMVVEGSFDEAPAERIADVAFAAYQAVARGAPAEVVEGIGLYGFRKKIPGERLAVWANGYHQMTRGGVPPEVAADLVRAAMENDWEDSAFDIFKWSLVQAARQRFDTRSYAVYLLGHMQRGGQRPGALTAQAQAYFRKLAKTGGKPELPPYEGVFTPAPPPAPIPETTTTPAPEEAAPEPATAARADPAPKPAAPPATKTSAPKNAGAEMTPPARPKPRKTETASARFEDLWPGLERSSKAYLGTPYVWGGVTRKGIDCSALTQNSYGENAVGIPRVSRQQWKTGAEVNEGRWREGDLLFFNTMGVGVSHVGMVVDTKGPQFIHASSSKGVVIADLSKNYYRTRYLGARRIVP